MNFKRKLAYAGAAATLAVAGFGVVAPPDLAHASTTTVNLTVDGCGINGVYGGTDDPHAEGNYTLVYYVSPSGEEMYLPMSFTGLMAGPGDRTVVTYQVVNGTIRSNPSSSSEVTVPSHCPPVNDPVAPLPNDPTAGVTVEATQVCGMPDTYDVKQINGRRPTAIDGRVDIYRQDGTLETLPYVKGGGSDSVRMTGPFDSWKLSFPDPRNGGRLVTEAVGSVERNPCVEPTATATSTTSPTVTATSTATATATQTATATATNTATATSTQTATATTTATQTSTTAAPPSTTAPPATTPAPTTEPTSDFKRKAPYTLPGYHEVSGRSWFTSCESYSQTERCRTEIWATQVRYLGGGKFTSENGWVFNNLTYLPSKRELWAENPLGGYGEYGHASTFRSGDRLWKVECDTAQTGRNGCRAYIWMPNAVEARQVGGVWRYRLVDQWVFNNIAMFS